MIRKKSNLNKYKKLYVDNIYKRWTDKYIKSFILICILNANYILMSFKKCYMILPLLSPHSKNCIKSLCEKKKKMWWKRSDRRNNGLCLLLRRNKPWDDKYTFPFQQNAICSLLNILFLFTAMRKTRRPIIYYLKEYNIFFFAYYYLISEYKTTY